jgi:hypothetical protein
MGTLRTREQLVISTLAASLVVFPVRKQIDYFKANEPCPYLSRKNDKIVNILEKSGGKAAPGAGGGV